LSTAAVVIAAAGQLQVCMHAAEQASCLAGVG